MIASNNGKLALLVVDDNVFIQLYLGRMLEYLHDKPFVAGNGKEAMDLMQQIKTDKLIILLDWSMPEMNGMAFLQALNSAGSTSSLPNIEVYIHSSSIDEELQKLKRNPHSLVAGFIDKPATEECLNAILRPGFNNHQKIMGFFPAVAGLANSG